MGGARLLVWLGGADLMKGDVEDAGAGVGWPALVGAAAGRYVAADGQEDAMGARLERDLAGASVGLLPECDHRRWVVAAGARAARHPVGGEGQHGGARIVGEHAGVTRAPARGE